MHLDVDAVGELAVVEFDRCGDVESGQRLLNEGGSRQARCGLPTSTPMPVNRRPPTVAEPVPSRLTLPISTVTSASPRRRGARRPVAGRPASRPRTRRGLPGRWPAGSGRTPARRCRTSARSSRRRCGSPCTSRRRRHLRAAGRAHPRDAAPAVVTRSTPSAPRPRRRSHSAATAAGARSSRGVQVGQQHEIVLRAVALGEDHVRHSPHDPGCAGIIVVGADHLIRIRAAIAPAPYRRGRRPNRRARDAVVAAEPRALAAHIAAGADERQLACVRDRLAVPPASRASTTWA